MLEAQQLRLEDAATHALAWTRTKPLRQLKLLTRRYAFWQLPSLDMLMPTGIWQRDDVFSHSHASSSYHDLTSHLFHEDYRDRDQGVAIEGDDADAVELAEQNFIPFRQYKHRPRDLDLDRVYWGGTPYPYTFIADYIAGPVLLEGSRCFRLEYKVLEGKTYITLIQPLNDEDLRQVRIGNRRGHFRYVWRPQTGWADEDKGPRVEYFPPDNVVCFEHPDGKKLARRTTRGVRRLMREDDDMMARMQLAAMATATPADKRTWMERARRLNVTSLIERARRTGWHITALWGGLHGIELSQVPTTSFYGAYAEVNYRKWLALFRESLCEQFSAQIVSRLLVRNGLSPDGARMVPFHLRASSEWEVIRQQLLSEEISVEEAQAIIYPSLRKADAGAVEVDSDAVSEDEDGEVDAPDAATDD